MSAFRAEHGSVAGRSRTKSRCRKSVALLKARVLDDGLKRPLAGQRRGSDRGKCLPRSPPKADRSRPRGSKGFIPSADRQGCRGRDAASWSEVGEPMMIAVGGDYGADAENWFRGYIRRRPEGTLRHRSFYPARRRPPRKVYCRRTPTRRPVARGKDRQRPARAKPPR